MKKVILGKTNIEVSYIGMGVLPIGPNQLCLPVDEGARVIRYALEKGINFFDTAQYYETYPYLAAALKNANQETVISSKSLAVTYDEMARAIEEARRELDRDVIDIFLLHEVRTGDFEERKGAWEALCGAKAKGLIKAMGVSTHNVDVTSQMADVAECDVVFPLINYAGLGIRKGNEAATAEEMLCAIEKCSKAGKGTYAMKVFGGGNLTVSYQEALNFVTCREYIDSLMVGFGKTREIDDIVNYMEGRMAPDYNPDTSAKRLIIEQANCEGCGRCKAMCQSEAIFYNKSGLAEIDPSKCLTCGYCAPVCPSRSIIFY